jgi:hypothetical protein
VQCDLVQTATRTFFLVSSVIQVDGNGVDDSHHDHR